MTRADSSSSGAEVEERLALVDSAQKAAGIIAARHHGDSQGAAALLADLDLKALAGGSLLLAELALGLYAHATNQRVPDCVTGLCLQLENEVRFAGPPPSR